MLKSRYFCGGSILAVALAMGLSGQAAAQDQTSTVEEVIVTGSFIAGTPEDAALPVDVIGTEELAKQGAPSVVQLVKTITAAQSSLGESNRYNGGAGTASINLRGLGASRTLVLMNGRRLADTTAIAFQGGGQDLNFIPTAAVGRIEILKDGAAATYGSDAVAGVVNFITRKDLDGFEIDANYALIDGSNGDYDVDLAYGKQFDDGNVLITAGYRHRSRLDVRERDWALTPFESVFYGGWSGSANPGIYAQPNGGAPTFQDNGCNVLGGQLLTPTFLPTTTVPPGSQCRFQFTPFNDLVNKENQYQLYAEVNYNFTEDIEFHGEVAWHRSDVPDQRISPANLTTQFPTPISAGGTSGSTAAAGFNGQSRFFIPANHPGLVNLRTVCAAPLTAAQCASMVNGVTASQTGWRAIGVAGHPTNSDKADHQDIERTAFRISAGLKGKMWYDIGWDAAVTYMENEGTVVTNDLLVNRIQNAFRGLGGPGCNPATGVAGVGACQYFNPFTNAIQVSGANGASNPYYQAAVANSPALVEWLYGTYTNVNTNSILVGDLVFNGDTGIELGGGSIRWAAGAQYRFTETRQDWEGLGDVRATPCVDSIDDGLPLCSNPVGPFVFFGAQEDFLADRRAWAAFGETLIPLTEDLEVTLAVRHEDFGGNVGTTTNPKVSARWQLMDWIALRASAGSTFRAPGEGQTSPGTSKGVSNIGGSYRAVVTANNPALEPETADTYNIGVVLDFGAFTASVDYYNFNFEGELGVEDTTGLFNALAQTGANKGCANAALTARFVFNNLGCGQANVLQMTRKWVNGPQTKTSGFDIRAQYEFENFFGFDFMDTNATVGVEATLLSEVKRGQASLGEDSSVIFAPAIDRAGLHDLGGGDFYSFPKTRLNAFVNLRGETWNLRWQVLYREGTKNVGAACTGTFPNYVQTPDCRFNYAANAYQSVGKTDAYWQHDLNLNVDLPWDTTVSASILNLFDEDPPFAQSFYNYDLTNGNPLGRVFKLGVKQRF
ncbi:MAG: TonB-dependent receptor [Phenylobacterium sp.]|uniref:TonB-dependent receptor domain-containing protein n=1 Tax=Phenylobacterium sp. TaxID=1871053 RepID=UPI0027331E96|nr:TonB-dependent receptor [Phenylobacterium sp.]MDP3749850.1 TonB-dependent receptor [Phenylobacterium sp.]